MMRFFSQPRNLERAARMLENSADFRVLRRIPEPFQHMEGNAPPDAQCVAIVDVETTGLSLADDEVIELAILLAWVSVEGEVLAHLGPWSWLADPGRPLSPEIMQLTGLCDADLTGQSIDLDHVKTLLDRADIVCAHNANFDIAWFDQLLPELADKPWVCSMREIDWPAMGFEGRSQSHLLSQHCWFCDAHRAGADVWSLLWLLMQMRADPDGKYLRSHFARLVESSAHPSVLISAHGAPFAAKDELKVRGYKWNALQRVWQKQFKLDDVAEELTWFRRKVLPEPVLRKLSAADRYR